MTDVSAEAMLDREIAKMSRWLAAHGHDLESDDAHTQEGSREHFYWRFGYFVGLKRALSLFSSGGATLH